MIIGIDYHNTITSNPKLFTKLIDSLLGAQHTVCIVTAVRATNVAKTRHALRRVPRSHIEIIIFENYEDIPRLKLEACKRLGIKMMFDDMPEVCDLLAEHKIMTFRVK